MKMKLKEMGLLLVTLLMLSACSVQNANDLESQNKLLVVPDVPNEEISVFIVGDSTASPYDDEFAPRAGWGQVFQQFFVDKVTVENKARSGRSSMSYLNEGHFESFVDEIKENDYLLIQFGHNDQKSDDPSRYTNPFTTYKEHLSVYIDAAIERGATPILLTPVNRNQFDGSGKLKLTHGQYPRAMRELAEEKNVALIDITDKSQQLFESLGPEQTKELIFLHLPPGQYSTYPEGVQDDTHFKQTGAIEIAKLVIEGLLEQGIPLSAYIKSEYQKQ